MNWRNCTGGLVAAGLLAGVPLARGAYEGTGVFTKIAARADLTDGYYVIASSNGLAAMTHTNAGTFFTSNAISPAGDSLTNPSVALVWLIQTNATHGGLTIYNEASNRYATYAGSANAVYPAGAVNGTTGTWVFTYASGAFNVSNTALGTRSLQYNAGAPRFACYATAQMKLALYKLASSSSPPAFTSGTNYGATSLVAMAFTVTATGTPAPALALAGTTASGGYSFTAGTGQLSYTPPTNDAGARTFTFTASNSAGVATQVVNVGVTYISETAPEFGANPGPVSVTATVAAVFTVTASGVPAPVLALAGTTAASGYDFAPGTGQLTYTAPAGDIGAQSFTFTASNTAGVATQTVAVTVVAVAPSFGANPGPLTATATVARAFTVTATGYPAPVLALAGTTASGGHSFTAGTGQLSYTPPTNDVGAQEFVFSASNGAGVAMQTVSVSVAAAPVFIPTVSVTDIGTNSFTVNWTACTDATNYQVQVATDTNFTAGASGSSTTLVSVGNTGVSNGWAYVNGASNAGTYHKLVSATAPGVVSAEFSTLGYAAATAEYAVATFGGSGANVLTISYSLDGGTNWVAFGTNSSATSSTYVTGQKNALPAAALGQAAVRIKWHCDVATVAMGLRLQALGVTGVELAGPGSLVADETVAALTYAATGLDLSTTYHVRARQAGGEWSTVVAATTVGSEPAAPWFTSGTAHGATVEVATVFTVVALGTPAPALALAGTTATNGGYSFAPATGQLSYTPPVADADTTNTFTFTASNSLGVATQTVSVAVVAVAPAFGANPGPVAATATLARAFTVTAAGHPAPVLALQSQTASSGYSFTPATGVLDYMPPTNDIGMQTFTFTASNRAGVATQVVSVAVAAAPTHIPVVSVANINTNSFTVNWTACTAATNYQVQVATDTNFTAGGGGNLMSNAGFETGDSTDWDKFETEYSVVTTDPQEGTYHVAITATGTRDLTQNVDLTGDGTTAYEISYWYKGTGSARIWAVWNAGGQVSGDSLQPASYNPAAAEWTKMTYTVVPQSGANTLSFEIRTYAGASMQFDNFFVGVAGGGGGGGSLVVDETVAALTYAAAGLELSTTYYIRARQAGGEWSSVVQATTADPIPTAPYFGANPGPFQATAGVDVVFTVVASGFPAPVLELTNTTATVDSYLFEPETGFFVYVPPTNDVGVQIFHFAATNTEGRATQAVTVNVAAATAPAFGANPGPVAATAGVARVFTVTATGVPAPVLALRGATATLGSYTFTASTGALSYTPPAADTNGTQVFTFTASNLAGVVTQAVSVTVAKFPAPPTLDPAGPVAIAAGQTTNLWIVARETDGQLVTLVASNLPANASFTNTTGTGVVSNRFTFSPAAGQAGQAYSVVFYAGDSEGTNAMTLYITVASDDPWADYYATCYTNGVLKTGTALKTALHDIIDGHTQYSYTQAETILGEIDECPTNSTMVQLLYLQIGRAKSNFGGGVGQWNREHVWANSHGINDVVPAYSDVHHLHPTDVTVNSTRGNLDFDTVDGLSNSYSVSSTAFEPPNAGKGDVARAMFYMAVRYDGSDGIGDLELTNTIPTSGNLFGKLSTLLNWHELDPVNDYEIRRNNLVYTNWQHNRNPFVDHPEWARAVFDTNYLAMPAAPASFSAASGGPAQINLSFATNAAGNPVVVVWNETGDFTAPSGTAYVGFPFAGGTVLYQGTASPQSHTGLTSCATYYYKCWSVSGTNYSVQGLTASAGTTGPDAPLAVWASATNGTDFTAAWSAVAGAGSYRLDVGTGPSFSGAGGGGATIFRETMGISAGTTLLVDHEAADGFDNDAYAMTDGGAADPVTVRTTSGSLGYVDPAGNAASSNANVYFAATNVGVGFAIEGIDPRGYDSLGLSFGYRKEAAGSNMAFSVAWSTNGGAAWNPITISNFPAEGAAVGWYMVSNLAVSAVALDATNLSLRWEKTGGAAWRVDDILLQGYSGGAAAYLPGYSNRTVAGTSQSVTGLTAGATYYFRVAAISSCTGAFSSVANVTTPETLVAPVFGANPGPLSTTVGVAVAFGLTVAEGVPPPVLALAGTTATSGYAFDAGTGQLTYTPTAGDLGAQTFTFTASNSVGVATQVVGVSVSDVPAEAPVITSGASYSATTSVATAFTVTATGYPAPALALAGTTASGGHGFTPGTGLLTYTPPEADLGAQTFTFTASNGAGVATQTVTVSVAAGLPAPPATVWASATNILGFTAAWAAAPLATEYRLDVSTSATFQVGSGASLRSVLASNAATSPALLTNGWSGTNLGGTTYVILTQATSVVVSPAFSTVGFTNLTVDFQARTYSGGTYSNITVSISTNNGTNWVVMGVVAPTDGTLRAMATLTNTVQLGHGQTRIRWQALDANGTIGVGVRYLAVNGWAPDTVPAYVAGYSNRTVAGTSAGVTGLTAAATYFFRVRAVNVNGSGADSAVASVTTLAQGGQAIDFPAIGDQVATNVLVLSATASSGLPVGFAVGAGPATITNGTTLSFSGTGVVSIVASQAGDGNWSPAPDVTNTFSVTKATASVGLGDLAQTYDGTARLASATTFPAGLAVVFTYDGASAAPTNAGTYAVTGTVNDARYQGSATGVLVVAKAAAAVALGDLAQTYNGAARVVSTVTTPAGLGVELTYAGNAWAPTNAGTYAVTGTISAANYTGMSTGMLVVAKASQGIAFPALGDQVATGAVGLSASADSGLAVVFAVSAGPATLTGETNLTFSAAGLVSIVASQAGDGNWSPAPDVTNTFSVTKATASVGLGDLAQTYDGTARLASATTFPAGLAVEFTYDGLATAPTNAGTYAVTGTVNDVNHAGSAAGVLEVSKADQTIDFPALGDQAATNVLALAATASSGLAVEFSVGSGPATITNGATLSFTGAGAVSLVAAQAGDGNWNAAPPATNAFTVDKALAGVTLGDLAQSYDGTAKSATATTEPAGLSVEFTYDGQAWAPTNAGSYEVVATVNEALYQGSVTGVLMISQASEAALVTLDGLWQTYDGSPKAVTATTDPVGLEVELTYDGSAAAPTNAGSYVVTGTVKDVNYAGSAVATLVVAQAAATVTLGDLAQTYDGTARPASATTAPPGLAVVLTYAGNAWAPTNAGSYAVTGTVADANYEGAASATLVVAPATATVTLSDLEQTYDGTPQGATVATVPAGLAVVVTYDGSGTVPSATGTYVVVAAVAEVNYAGSATGTLAIAEALSGFERWLRDEQGQSLADARFDENEDYDGDGMTTWQEYLADTDPATNGSVFVITGQYTKAATVGGTGRIRLAFPASTNRYYQLEYCLKLTNASSIGVSNLGWGVSGMAITNSSTGTWYGVIRALLAEP